MAGSASDISRWVGATNTAFATGTNFATVAGAPTAPPAAGESLIVDEKAVANLVTGPASSVALASFEVKENCGIEFGDEGAPLDNIDPTLFEYLGAGPRANFLMTAAQAIIYRTNARLNFANGSNITNLVAKRSASVRFGAEARCDIAFVQGVATFESITANHLQRLYLLPGARVTCRRNITVQVVVCANAELTLLDDARVSDGAATTDAATLIVAGGRVNAWSKNCILHNIIGIAGVIDPTKAPNDVKYRERTFIGDGTVFNIVDSASGSSLVLDSGYGGTTGSTALGSDDPAVSRTDPGAF